MYIMNWSPEKPSPDHPCLGCHYFRNLGLCYACHYLLITGRQRQCSGGRECRRRKPFDEALYKKERDDIFHLGYVEEGDYYSDDIENFAVKY